MQIDGIWKKYMKTKTLNLSAQLKYLVIVIIYFKSLFFTIKI